MIPPRDAWFRLRARSLDVAATRPRARMFHTTGAKPGARWQKVMYVRQSYPDNHVDETFLASLVTNGARGVSMRTPPSRSAGRMPAKSPQPSMPRCDCPFRRVQPTSSRTSSGSW